MEVGTLDYLPAAPASALSYAMTESLLACPECGTEARTLYGWMGSGESLKCGACYDDWYFAERPEWQREKAEAHRDMWIDFVLTGKRPGGD